MQYFSNEAMLRTYVIWTMGNLGNISYPQIRALALATAAGLAIAFLMVKAAQCHADGRDLLQDCGSEMQRTRIVLLAAASILAGSVTAFCGPLAFIGVAVPHIARLLFGT
jgi:iron complex transport system permease protein